MCVAEDLTVARAAPDINGDLKRRIHGQPPVKHAEELTRKTQSCS